MRALYLGGKGERIEEGAAPRFCLNVLVYVCVCAVRPHTNVRGTFTHKPRLTCSHHCSHAASEYVVADR